MTVTRRDWQQLQERLRGSDARAQQVAADGLLRRAVLDMQAVTGHPAWDNFLTYLQAQVDEIEAQTALIKAEVFNPSVYDDQVIAMNRQRALVNDTVVRTLREVMAFPKRILSQAEDKKDG